MSSFYEGILAEHFGSVEEALDILRDCDGLKKATVFLKEETGIEISRQTLANIFIRHGVQIPVQKYRRIPRFLYLVRENPDKRPVDILRIYLGDNRAKAHENQVIYESILHARRRLGQYEQIKP